MTKHFFFWETASSTWMEIRWILQVSSPHHHPSIAVGWVDNDWISQANCSQPTHKESWWWRVAVLGTRPPQWSLVREQHGWRDDGSVVWSICCTSRGPSSILSTHMGAHRHLLTPVWWVYGALFWHLSVLHAYSALTNMQAKMPPPTPGLQPIYL